MTVQLIAERIPNRIEKGGPVHGFLSVFLKIAHGRAPLDGVS